MPNEIPTAEDEMDSSTSRRSFLKSTGAIAGPVVFSETVRSETSGGQPLVLEVKTGYRLPDGLPTDDDIRPSLSATCSPSSYHVKGNRLQVMPTASEKEVEVLESENTVVISDGISAFSPPMWGDTEERLRLNPGIGIRQVSSLVLDDEIRSPQV